ncbi:MAG: biotin/lipoyl-binding protein, partial [bacterium]
MTPARSPILWLLILPLLVITSVGADCKAGGKKEEAKETDYAAAELGDLSLIVKATGTVEPKEITRLKSEASGKILSLHVEPGDQVKNGDVIAVLDQWRQELNRDRASVNVRQSQQTVAELQRGTNVSAIRAAETAVENARIQLEQTQSDQHRTRELFEQGFASERDMEAADRAVESAKVAHDRALKDLAQQKEQGNPDNLRAAQLNVAAAQIALQEASREV